MVEGAHVRGRSTFRADEPDRIFNIVKVCPTYHSYFDYYGAFTIHHDWRCWIFSDIPTFRDSKDNPIPNPFYGIKYAYCRLPVQREMDSIEDEHILAKQIEFKTKRNVGKSKFFDDLKLELQQLELWDNQENKPLHATLSRTMEFNLTMN
jgi:hypothetical protein